MKEKFTKIQWEKILLSALGVIFLVGILYLSLFLFNKSKTLYISSHNVTCTYHSKFNTIICEQIDDIVPKWLKLNDQLVDYSMQLVFSRNNKDYRVMNMTDKVFIADMNRKFIYELKNQTFSDWNEFKQYVKNKDTKVSNWGSVVLYCSEDNLEEDVCKEMKRNNK